MKSLEQRQRELDAAAAAIDGAGPITRQQFSDLIESCDDLDQLLGPIAERVANSGLKAAQIVVLQKQIALKTKTNLSALRQDADTKPNQDERYVEALNRKHAVVPIGGQVVILNEDHDPSLNRPMVTFSRKADFQLRYGNRRTVKDGEEMDIGSAWLESPKRRQYKGIAFAPGRDIGAYYNLFRGFPIDPAPGPYTLFAEFVRDVICAENEDAYDYVWKWLAHIFQRPEELPGTALVMRGSTGIGKNAFMRIVGVLCGHHYVELTNMGQLVGRFSGHLASALLVYANEAVWGGDKNHEGALKGLITDDMSLMERKFSDAIMVRNYKRLVIGSNENWAAPRARDCRRFVCLDVASTHRRDRGYFGRIFDEMRNGGYAALMYALTHVDIQEWHPSEIPESLERLGSDLKTRSETSCYQWYEQCLDNGYVFPASELDVESWPDMARKDVVYGRYLAWCKERNIQRPQNDVWFARELHSFGVVVRRPRDGGRKRQFVFPPIETAKMTFIEVAKLPHDHFDDGPGMQARST